MTLLIVYKFSIMLIMLFIAVISVISIVWVWVSGIDYMRENHPDYKGEDFLNWDGENNDWDNTHTEGEI